MARSVSTSARDGGVSPSISALMACSGRKRLRCSSFMSAMRSTKDSSYQATLRPGRSGSGSNPSRM